MGQISRIKTGDILPEMLGAAKAVLDKHWKEAKPFAEQEFKALAQNLKLIGQLAYEEKISKEQAKHYIEIQKSSVRIVLLTIEGLGIIVVETAINEAIAIVKNTVNTGVGWNLI